MLAHQRVTFVLQSNEWTGKNSFDGHSLHQLGAQPNPYEEAMMIIGRTLSKFDDDQLIPAYGFGDGELVGLLCKAVATVSTQFTDTAVIRG